MKTIPSTWMISALMAGLFLPSPADAYAERVTVLPTVGPAHREAKDVGYLIVYSAVIPPKINPDTMFLPHSPYTIYDGRHAFVRSVKNHIGPWDESPFVVPLRPGRYYVRAESEFAGEVETPVVIVSGRNTVVDLQRRGVHR